jgi:antitoxin MazE
MRATLSKWGNSLAVRLPREAAASAGLREGTIVELTVDGDAIVMRRRRYDIDELVSLIDRSKQPDLLAEDGPRGTEEW